MPHRDLYGRTKEPYFRGITLHLSCWSGCVRVHAQRPGKGLQAKQSESLRAQDSAIQKRDQNRNNMFHSLCNHTYALNHIQLVKWTFHNYEVYIFKVLLLAIIYHRFHEEKEFGRNQISCAAQRYARPHWQRTHTLKGITSHRQSITPTEHPTMAA